MAPPVMMSRISDDISAITGAEHSRLADDMVVTEPADANSIAAIIRYAHQQRLSVGIRGGGTKQRWARGKTRGKARVIWMSRSE